MMKELTKEDTWIPIRGFDGYFATRDGKIKGPSRKIMKQMRMPSGHLYVLCNRGRCTPQRKLFVHRAVLLAFVGYPQKDQECRHLDGDPENNNVDNLDWGTKQENVDDRWVHGTMPIPHLSKSTRLSPKDIPKIFDYSSKGFSSRKIGKIFSTSHTTILKILRGERWKGYHREQE